MTDEAKQLVRQRRMDQYLEQEGGRRERERDHGLEPTGPCPQRIGIRFAPVMETEDLLLIATFVCEERGPILLRSIGEKCWGCPDCGLKVGFPEAQILARASGESLVTLRKSMKTKWPWHRWFRNKKASPSSES